MADELADLAVEDTVATTSKPDDAATLRPLPRSAHFSFRGRPDAALQAGQAFGVALPTVACRADGRGERAALWLGPDEWLLIAPAAEQDRIKADIGVALADTPHSLVAVGHRDTSLRIDGPRAADVLNAGCPLDLDETAFPVGMCTRTILAKAQIVLWRTGQQSFTVTSWRSFAAYVREFLLEARARL